MKIPSRFTKKIEIGGVPMEIEIELVDPKTIGNTLAYRQAVSFSHIDPVIPCPENSKTQNQYDHQIAE